MVIGDRLRSLREQRNLSQGDIEKRTGLLRCYVSRVENGHTVPAIETLEKMARALGLPLYQLLYDGEEPPREDTSSNRRRAGLAGWGSAGKDLRFMRKLQHLLPKMQEEDRELLMFTLEQMTRRKKRAHSAQRERQVEPAPKQEAEPVQPVAAAASASS